MHIVSIERNEIYTKASQDILKKILQNLKCGLPPSRWMFHLGSKTVLPT